MRNRIMFILSAILGFGLAIGDLPLVCAQEEFSLEEITVTAQKREENQQDVPITMDVITGDQIKELGMSDIDQILSSVSGININKTGDGLRISMRSMSQDSGANWGPQSSSPTVAINLDGVYTARNSTGQNLYDMDRVEVLFGPQSTLYASNSPGGIVNIQTADPRIDDYEAAGTIEYGSYNLMRTEGIVNAPISKTLALRAAYSTSVHDGYLNNGADNLDLKSARIKALFQPTDKVSFLLTGEYTVDNSMMGFSGAVAAFEDQDDLSDPWGTATSLTPAQADKATKKIFGRFNWDMGFGTLTIVPARTTYDNNTQNIGLDPFGNEERQQVIQSGFEKGIETRVVSSPDSFLSWIGGINWYKSEDSFFSLNLNNNSTTDMKNGYETTAFYGNVTYPVADRFRLNAGARHSKDDATQYELRSTRPTPVDVAFNDTSWSYKAGVQYDIKATSMLYADYSTGSRAQLAQTRDWQGNPFPPERLKSITIGIKNRFFENKLQLNAAGYYYKYTDYLAVDMVRTIADTNGNGVRDPDETTAEPDDHAKTTGDLNILGVDVQTNYILTKKDLLNFSVSYLKSEFMRLSFDFEPITNSLGIPDQNLKGKGKTNSPEFTFDVAYSHNFTMGNGGILTARIDSRYQTSCFLEFKEKSFTLNTNDYTTNIIDITKQRNQEAYHLTNLSAIYAHPDGKWTFTGYVKNLENYAVKKSWTSGLMVIGSPRTYGAILSVTY